MVMVSPVISKLKVTPVGMPLVVADTAPPLSKYLIGVIG